VVDFADPRVSALLQAGREDELVQVIHRARLVALQSQQQMLGMTDSMGGRRTVRLVLHTSHPVPGLRVDELHVVSHAKDLNEQRRLEAEARVIAAATALSQQGKEVSMSAVAREAKAHKATVAKILGRAVHTPKKNVLYRGMNRLPQIADDDIQEDVVAVNTNSGAPKGRCATCLSRRWWHRRDGGWVCGVCHPNPAELRLLNTIGTGPPFQDWHLAPAEDAEIPSVAVGAT
jgi:hypothetical protein